MPVEDLPGGMKRLAAPLDDADVRRLRAGDRVTVCGRVLGARDAAHRRLVAMLGRGEPLPVELAGQIVYYVGPSPARPGAVVGAAGPTTASRMDPDTPPLLERGLKAVIGKGGRGPAVREALRRHVACALAALGGGGALAARCARAVRVLAFDDLGPEALLELELEDLPAWVVHDCYGADHYETAWAPWRRDDALPEALRRGPAAGEVGGG
jgi:fumarate hydratase subunit beta